MNYKHFFAWLATVGLLIFLFFAPRHWLPFHGQAPYLLADIRVDSVSTFQLDQPHNDAWFIFSPLRENAVWIIGTEYEVEIDLLTGKSTNIGALLKDSALNTFGIPGIDPYRKHSFFYTRDRRHLIRYDNGNKTIIHSEDNSYTSTVFFEKDSIWIGGSYGLLVLDRASGQTKKVEGLPAVQVIRIEKTRDGKLLLNSTILYDSAKRQWEIRTSGEDCANPYHQYWFIGGMDTEQGTHKVLHYRDQHNFLQPLYGKGWYHGNLVAAKHAVLWTEESYQDSLVLNRYDFIHDEREQFRFPMYKFYAYLDYSVTNGQLLVCQTYGGWILLNRKDGQFYYYSSKIAANFRKADMDSRHLYLLLDDRMMIISLDWLLKNAIPLDRFQGEMASFKLQLDSLILEQEYTKKKALYEKIRAAFGKTQNPFIIQRMLSYDFSPGRPYNIHPDDPAAVKWMEAEIARGKVDSVWQVDFYVNAISHFTRQLDISNALKFAGKYSALTGISKKDALGMFNIFLHRIDSLKQLRLPDDEYAYAYAAMMEKYCMENPAFESESMYNLELPTEAYKEMSRKYPNSRWADDAAYTALMIELFNYCEGGCSYTEDDLKRLDRFVQSFPESEKIADAWLAAVNILQQMYGDDEANRRKNATRALSYLMKIRENYPASAEKEEWKDMLMYYLQYPELYWSLSVSTDKKVYKQGEPMKLIVKLKNLNDTTQTFHLPPGPLFHLMVTYSQEPGCAGVSLPFKKNYTLKQQEQRKINSITVAGKTSKTWTFNLLSESFLLYRTFSKAAIFDFSRKGYYQVSLEAEFYSNYLNRQIDIAVE